MKYLLILLVLVGCASAQEPLRYPGNCAPNCLNDPNYLEWAQANNPYRFQQPLGPVTPNAYGPGVNSDGTGRPFTWQPLPGFGPPDPLSRVQPNVYGPGIGMDQYGRPVQPTP